ncbi:SatD family protein [Myroides sp. LJL115]
MKYTILMADIIDSRRVDQALLITEFTDLVEYINEKYKMEILSPLTITLGDEFQGVIGDMVSCFKIIFSLEEFILEHSLSLKLRYVVNFGDIDTEINPQVAYGMLGKGLSDTRELLNSLKTSSNRFKLLSYKDIISTKIINDLFFLYESYIDSWKPKDYKMVSEFLRGQNYKEVAHSLQIDNSSAWRRYKSLNIEEYKTAKELILSYTLKL